MQVALARMGVGIGEAGGSPPSHSIISDMYPKEERASALGVYSMGIPLGIMAAYFVTASLMDVSETGKLEADFYFLGLTGIALAVVVKLVLKERFVVQWNYLQAPQFQNSFFRVIEGTYAYTGMVGNVFWNSIWVICFICKIAFQTKYLVTLDPSFDFQTLVIILGIMNGTTYAGGALEQDWQIDGAKRTLERMVGYQQ